MTIDDLIADLQALPAHQRGLPAYTFVLDTPRPLKRPAAEERVIEVLRDGYGAYATYKKSVMVIW